MKRIESAIAAFLLCSCSPKIIEQVRTEVEYRDRIIHDTATVHIPVEKDRIVTLDTVSRLENSFARSEAIVSGGVLSHSLESKPQVIKVPVAVKVTDTLWRESEIKTVEKEIYREKELSWWQQTRLLAFPFLLLVIAFAYRKQLLSLIKILFKL